MPTIVRFGTVDDAALVHRLIQHLAEYEQDGEAVQLTLDALRQQMALPTPPFECLLAERDARPAGFALFFHTYSTWTGKRSLYLEDLFVVESERGNGVGSALLRRLAGIAVERDCGRIELSVLDWNEPAIAVYRSVGAEAMSDWTTYRVAGDALKRLAGD
jgi:GNAT superfamily N-acetyltransferase